MVGAFKVGLVFKGIFFGHVYRRKLTPKRQLPRDAGGAHATGGWEFLGEQAELGPPKF